MRSVADKSLIVISLESYSLVSRLLELSFRSETPRLKKWGIELEVSREDMKSLFLGMHFENVTYNFTFPNNGWLSISEETNGNQSERFNMGFFRDDNNFSYSGDRDFCLEICQNLIRIIQNGFNIR